MRLFTLFSRFCAIFAFLVITAFTAESHLNGSAVDNVEAFDDDEAFDADSSYFVLPVAAAEAEACELENTKATVLSILPTSMRKRAEPIETGDFLTIQQLVQKGAGNFPQTKWNTFRFMVWGIAAEAKATYPNLGCETLQLYDWMMKTFRLESGFRSDIKTPLGSAAGLFQVTAGNRKRLGFPNNWTKLSPLEQLPWYKVYLFHALDHMGIDHAQIKDCCDFYMINFMPAYAGCADNKVIASACGGKCKKFGRSKHFCAYHANTAFDLNRDGRIQKYEVGQLMERKFLPASTKAKKGAKTGSLLDVEQGIKVPLNSEHFDMLAFNFRMPLTNLRVLI